MAKFIVSFALLLMVGPLSTSVASAQASAEENACILSAVNKMPQRAGPITASRVTPFRDTRPGDAEMLPGDAELLIVELDFSTSGINATTVFMCPGRMPELVTAVGTR